MHKNIMLSLIVVGSLSLSALPASAEDGASLLEKYDEIYDNGAFERLSNNTEYVTYDSYTANLKGAEKTFADARWNKAIKNFDADGDGQLSRPEARAYRDAERAKLIKHKDFSTFAANHPDWVKNHPWAAQKVVSNSEWLEKHPQAAKELLENREWLEKHPDVAKAAFKNRKYLDKHPDVAKKLYENREWLNNHPDVAKEAYKNRKFLDKHPEFSKDLYKHRKYLADHPDAAKKAYKASQNHPDAAKKAYTAAKEHPVKANQARKHPHKAKKVIKERRGR